MRVAKGVDDDHMIYLTRRRRELAIVHSEAANARPLLAWASAHHFQFVATSTSAITERRLRPESGT
jgi:hypothetical protein